MSGKSLLRSTYKVIGVSFIFLVFGTFGVTVWQFREIMMAVSYDAMLLGFVSVLV